VEINNLTIGIGGMAGAGIMESGNIWAKFGLRSGLQSFIVNEYPSLIRGGHNFTVVRLKNEPVSCLKGSLDLLIALNEETISLHQSELAIGGGILYDSDQIKNPEQNQQLNYYGIPLTSIAKESGGTDLLRNTAALGGLTALLNGQFIILQETIKDIFAHKNSAIVDANIKAALKAYKFMQQNTGKPFGYALEAQEPNQKQLLIDGNQGICLGALRAGVKFVAIYPMTPITSILDFFAKNETEYNLVVREPEDEIAAINMAIGASYAGARAMTATSGGGFCLMTEGLGLAGMAEIPLVVIEGMRGGPSTGLPTKTEQSDLQFVVNAGHGEFPKIVLAPGDPTECFEQTFQAFNLADKYQLPVIILTDKYLGNSSFTATLPESQNWQLDRGVLNHPNNLSKLYYRYSLTENGVSPRAFPGQPGAIFHATSDEHDESGMAIDHSEMRTKMMQKRMSKLEALAQELPEPILYGQEEADITLVGWGSSKGVILEALKILEEDGIKANFLHLLYIWPFPAYFVSQVLDRAKTTLIIENNYNAQMARYIRENTGRSIGHKLLKYDGNPFTSSEIVQKVKEIKAKTVLAVEVTAGGQNE
jgi:2-oxoglutarate ferredoxin oxidoreductase subunit alpha